MFEFTIKDLTTRDIKKELLQIGYDNSYASIASEKFEYKNIKIYNLSPAQANIIKQTALTVGADCGTNKEVICGKIEKSNAILGGSISQLKKICEKLKHQPFSLKLLGEQIVEHLKSIDRTTKIVGILNITPDSFSDGGKYMNEKSASEHLIQMIEEGADMIDIGAESTRPYSQGVSAKEQIKRLSPILNFIQKENIKTPISVDTRSADVADFVLNCGVSIINDVSGFDFDKKMAETVAKYKAGVILQHSKGVPQNMQDKPIYNDVIEEIYFSLKSKADYAKSCGINNVIIDPGIGFGKTKKDNFEILNRVEEFYSLNLPVMIGVSRKSLLGIKNDDNNLKDSLTAAISYPLVKSGIDYLRVHNVKLHKNLLNLLNY